MVAERVQALVGLCDGLLGQLDASRVSQTAVGKDRRDERPAFGPAETTPFPSTNTLCDLADVVRDLARAERRRATVRVRMQDEPCEIGLERAGDVMLVSVYSGGAIPTVHLFERRVDALILARALASALDLRAQGRGAQAREAQRAASARDVLEALVSEGLVPTTVAEETEVVAVEPMEDLPFSLSGELWVRRSSASSSGASSTPPSVLRTDLLGLLGRGRVRISWFGHVRELSDVHVYLVAEQLAHFGSLALEAYAAGRPLWRKTKVGGVALGVRVLSKDDGEPRVALTMGSSISATTESWTFPSLEVSAFARAVADLGRSVARAIVRCDRSQTHNLRLIEFRANLREIGEQCREVSRDDAVVNVSPESYRAYGKDSDSSSESLAPRPAADPGSSKSKLRFEPKWSAAVPSIDLRSTFQCGDAFVVGSARELSCIDRKHGGIVWTRPIARGVSVLTPCGLARFDQEGILTLIDLATGETRSSMRLLPRVGSPVTGAVVSSPGLPRMLVISEGRRHLVGVDLEAGEVLWRYAARRAATFRLRRAGRLVVVSSGEQALTAIDVVGGNTVWRYCDRLRFAHPVTVADDSLFALAGDGAFVAMGGTRLCHLDPWSGESRWSAPLREGARPIGAPLVARSHVLVATLGGQGTRLTAFDKKTGERAYDVDACAGTAAALIVDDLVVLNSESGEVVGIDASDGSVRYRHALASSSDGDRPRRLDPVLRSGALFVPQGAVHVLRPADGAILGTIETDLVPDLVRVDERCDVYVAEESGHVQAFAATTKSSPPHLRLVRS